MADTPFVRGADKLLRRISTIRANLDLPDLMDEIAMLLLRRTLDRFDKEVDPDGKPWPDLSKETIRTKRRKGLGKRKLISKGEMRSAISVIRGGLGSTFTNTGAGFRIGIQDDRIAKYARIQNRGNRHIPARRFLGIGSADIKAVDALLRRKARQLENL